MDGRMFGRRSWVVVAAGLTTTVLLLAALAGWLPGIPGLSGTSRLPWFRGLPGPELLPIARGRAAGPELRVVATTTVFADLVANVGGERVEVISLIPVGADPHTWEPSTRQARAVAGADVFFYNGLGLEPWAERTIASVGHRDLLSVRLSEGLEPVQGVSFHAHGHGHDDEDGDPHFWLDIANAIHYVKRIEQALSDADPSGATYYRVRAEQYVAELAELDDWFAAQIERIPPERRVLVTYHDAYVYMANRYGLELVGFLVRNPDREPAPREMAELVQTIQERGVPTIFAEPQVNARFAQALAKEAGVRVGILYTDALTEDVPTYIEMMRANGRALVDGLVHD